MSNPFSDLSASTANPFKSAKVVGSVTAPSQYFDQTAKRGEPGYIISRSDLVEFAKCPRRWLLGFSVEETESMAWGSLIDCLLLTPERFKTDYVVKPSTYRDDKGVEKKWNGNAKYCKEWEAEHEGKRLVGADMWDAAQIAIERMMGDDAIAALVKSSQRQVMVTGEFCDESTGITVPVRCMIDLVPAAKHWIGDLKTVRAADEFSWKWTVFRSKYHVQAAMYLDLWNAATGDDRELFAYVCSENVHPYEPAAWAIGSSFISIGRGFYASALQDYCYALKSGVWRGYEQTTETAKDGFGIIEPDAKMLLQDA